MKTAFITGATGFIGLNLVAELTARNWQVTALHRPASDLRWLRQFPVSLAEGDLRDPASLVRAMPESVDVVFHVAADTSTWSARDRTQTEINVAGTRNVVQAALRRGAKRLVLTSTAAAWGKHDQPIREETQSNAPRSRVNYERSKWLSEQEARRGMEQGLPVVIVNPCAVMGPRDRSVWGQVFQAIRDGKMKVLPPGRVPVNHVADVVDAHIAAAEKGRPGENYILPGETVPFADIFREMARLQGIELKARVVSAPVFKAMAWVAATVARIRRRDPELTPEMATLLCHDSRVETDKAERELGYRQSSWRQCLADSHAWLVKEGLL